MKNKKLLFVWIFIIFITSLLCFYYLESKIFSYNLSINKSSKTSKSEDTKVSITEGTIYKDITYKDTNEGAIKLDIYTPINMKFKKSPVIVYIHGGSWLYGDKSLDNNTISAMNKIREEGFTIISIDYRLISEKINFSAPIEDCKDAVRWIYKNSQLYNIDANNIGLWGVSAGAHLAMMTAYSSNADFTGCEKLKSYPIKINYVIDYCGPTNLILSSNNELNNIIKNFIGFNKSLDKKEIEVLLKKASPINYLTKNSPATLIVHGEKDVTVPISQSNDLYNKGRELGIKMEFMKIPEAGHDLSSASYMNLIKIAISTLQFIKNNSTL